MPYDQAAVAGFEKARELYTGKRADGTVNDGMTKRLKSSNKLHLAANSGVLGAEALAFDDWSQETDPAHQIRLDKAGALMGKERISTKVEGGKILDIGLVLRLSQTQTMNCGELSYVAAEWAWRELGKPSPPPVGLINLRHPADHVFCAVGDLQRMGECNGFTIGSLATWGIADPLYAVDPWLNIVCHITNYPQLATAKLDKWQQGGKRVAWGSGPIGPGWYAPAGSYKTGFLQAVMEVIPA